MIILQDFNKIFQDFEAKKIINILSYENPRTVTNFYLAKKLFPIQKMPDGAKLIYDFQKF
jgi:hypothetical protein